MAVSTDFGDMVDSGFASLVANSTGPSSTSQDKTLPRSTLPHFQGSPSLAQNEGPDLPDLDRTGSTPLSDKASIKSHVSIPAIGTFPLGSLYIPSAMDSPKARDLGQKQSGSPRTSSWEAKPVKKPNILDNGDIFLILDLPEASTVGWDASAINMGTSKFQGIRDLPPGTHFIWISEPNGMSRCGYWFVTQDQGQVRLKQWDRYNEVLGEPASQFEARGHKDNSNALYPQLVPYDHVDRTAGGEPTPSDPIPSASRLEADWKTESSPTFWWRRLTSCIKEPLLNRVTGKKDAGEWLVDTSDGVKGELHFPQTTQLLKTVVGSEQTFLFPQDAEELNLVNLLGRDHLATAGLPVDSDGPDTTPDILRMLDAPGSSITEADVVGEIQFAFLTGLHLSNLSCIDQWWHLILKVVLRAHKLVASRPGLCHALIRTLHEQMVYNERFIVGRSGDMDSGAGTGILDIVPRNKARLREALTTYKRRLNETLLGLGGEITPEQSAVGSAFAELEEWFWRFGWDLRSDYIESEIDHIGGDNDVAPEYDDDDEYEPVIVDLDENGKEVGLVSWN